MHLSQLGNVFGGFLKDLRGQGQNLRQPAPDKVLLSQGPPTAVDLDTAQSL